GRQAVDELVEHPPEAGEAFKRPELEKFVEQDSDGLAAAVLGAAQEAQRGVERRSRVARRGLGDRKRRAGDNRLEETLRRGRRPLDIDVERARATEPLL